MALNLKAGEETIEVIPLSGTDFRNAIEAGDINGVAEHLPSAIRSQAEEIINMMGAQVAMSDPEQAQIAETLMKLIEETMDEAAASDDLLAAMRGLDQVKPVPPQRGPAVKDYGEREMDYKDIMSKILKSLSDKDWYELESATRDLKSRSVDEISAMVAASALP